MWWIIGGFFVLFFFVLLYSCFLTSSQISRCEECAERFECETSGRYKCYERKSRNPND